MGKTEKYDHMKLIGQYAGGHKNLITLGRCLAAVSAVMTLIPYYELWKIIRCAVNGENLEDIRLYAWSAVALIVGALLVYILVRGSGDERSEIGYQIYEEVFSPDQVQTGKKCRPWWLGAFSTGEVGERHNKKVKR